MKKILAVGLSSTLQKTILFPQLALDRVNRSSGYRIDASGKAVNAARVLNQLESGCVTSVSPLGRENEGLFLDLARKDGLEVLPVIVPGRTRYCYTLVDPGAGTTTELVVSEPVDLSEGASLDFERAEGELLSLIDSRLPRSRALLFAGSRPAAWRDDLCARICGLAAGAGVPVMADFHGKDLLLTLERMVPEVIKINEEEFCSTFGFRFPMGEGDLAEAIRSKSAELGNAVVITRGSKDTFAAWKGRGFHRPVKAVKALNATGCGDSFTAGFLYAWLADRDMEAALEKGAWCATRNALNFRLGSIRDPNEKGEGPW